MTEDSTDLSEGIVPKKLPTHIARSKSFAPWHKVRKQYVREFQWNKYVKNLVKHHLRSELQTTESPEWSAEDAPDSDDTLDSVPESIRIDNPLRCLVIPGDDLLDIRSLWKDTEDLKCYIRYLGFNERYGSNEENTQLYISNNDVVSQHRIHSDSTVLRDRFQSVANQNNIAYKYLKEVGPFHVVNLDLCDSLFPTQEGDLPSYYAALHRLTEFQLKSTAQPWLLFITTEVAPNEVDVEQFDALCIPTKENYKTNQGFVEEIDKLVPKEAFSTAESRIDLTSLSEVETTRLFGVAIGKALLSLSQTASPKWRVEMLASYEYGINKDKNVSMLSLAFQFRPITSPPVDTTGLSKIKVEPKPPVDEAALAIKLVKAVSRIENIDDTLEQDSDLFLRLQEDSANLLQAAGYSRKEYVEWVENGEQTNSL